MNRALDKMMPKIALPVIIVAAVMLLFVIVSSSKGTNEENNAYIRVINCIVSHNAVNRTQSDIEQCYTTVERDLGIRLQRYDSSNQ